MAYSDYGGYAYRNGERVIDRSDCTITPEDGLVGTPGMWPGFGAALAGLSNEEIQKFASYPSGHAVLGDGPIYVVMYKQTWIRVYRGSEEIDILKILSDETDKGCIGHEGGENPFDFLDYEWFIERNKADPKTPCVFVVDGFRIEVYWIVEDNYYMYARLQQPDGVVWHGFSGYGVGAGLEEAGYCPVLCDENGDDIRTADFEQIDDVDHPYKTEDREDTILRLWPGSIKKFTK